MRIAFSGAANTGKSTLLKSFLYTWNNYSTPSKTYRDIIKEENLSHSSKSNTTTQTAILDFMLDQVQGVDRETNIVYDRCPLDALAYTIWCHEKGVEGFDSKYVQNQITLVKESMRFLDIIFICKFNKDININHINSDKLIDRTLKTKKIEKNEELWKMAGYANTPSIEENIEELANSEIFNRIFN